MPRRLSPAAAIGAAIALAASVGVAASAELIAPDTTSFTLDNGLQVVVVEDHRAPIAYHLVLYKVGAADEPPGKSGIAHFLEHLLFKGTEAHPEGEFSAKIAEIGGSENAFTTSDYTGYHQTVAKEHLGTVMAFEADRMQNLILDEDDVLTERNVILEERSSRIDNDPGSQLSEAASAALYLNHPYGIPVIGWEHEMRQLDRGDARAFYDRYYTPNNAILVVGGDVTPDEVRQLAESTYGLVPRRAEPGPRVRPEEPPQLAARTVELSDPRVSQESVRRYYLVPSYASADDDREALALDLLADILGNGATSRLYRQLVIDQKVASSAGAWYSSSTIDDTTFGVYGVPLEDVSLDDLTAAIEAALDTVIESGVTEAELTAAKRRLIAETIYAQDSIRSLARMFGGALAVGDTVEEVQRWPSDLETVTVEEVNAVARTYIDERRSVTGRLLGAAPDERS